MPNIKYNMTFDEVLHEIFQTKGWYQGEDFKDGVYITIEDSTIVAKQFPKNLNPQFVWPLNITYGVTQMKYRRVYTQPEVERKC